MAVEIDGSMGEGGGQVLRTSLALSILTGNPVEITNIRSRRPKPGLQAQHKQAVDAAAAISRAEVTGAALHSQSVRFAPGEVRSGRYRFRIETAGAATLVLQTIFTPLSRAGSASNIQIEGGTHVSWSPSFDYIQLHWLPAMQQVGYSAQLDLAAAGFYPQGGGRIDATIRPAEEMQGFELGSRGRLLSLTGISAVANLDRSIAARQKRQALLRLEELGRASGVAVKIQTVDLPGRTKGTYLLLLAGFEGGRACYVSLGKLGKPAERVADEAVDSLEHFLSTGAAVDEYLADQLLLPAALASSPSTISTCQVTLHLLTQAELIRRFLPVQITISGEAGQPGLITVMP